MTDLSALMTAFAQLAAATQSALAAVCGLTAKPFVSRSGSTLTLGGEPWRMVGLNLYNCLGPWPSATNLVTALPQLLGIINTARVFAFQATATTAGQRDWTAWDIALRRFEHYGIRVIMVLTDTWGGQPVTDGPRRDLGWYTTGYRTTVECGVATYRDWVVEAVARYRDNPTIAMWQLVNEANVPNADGSCDWQAATNALSAFTDDMAALVKSIDPNHLLSSGAVQGACGGDSASWGVTQTSPFLDVMDYHDYAYPDEPMGGPLSPPGDTNNLTTNLGRAAANGKALIVGEMGIHWSKDISPPTQAHRADLFAAKLAAQFAAGSQGEFLWCWLDTFYDDPSEPDSDYEVPPGDPALPMLAAYFR